MIERIEITGINIEVDEDLHKYITKKIGRLDRFMSRHVRESVHVEVKLKELKRHKKKECTFEVILHVPHEVIATKETTLNMFAAVDIVETKLKNQLKKYKEKYSRRFDKRVLTKLRSHISN